MAACGGLERRALLAAQVDNLAAPAETNNSPRGDVRVLVLDRLYELGDALDGLWRGAGRLEKVAQLLALFFRVGRVPGNVCRAALEEVGHEDFVLVRLVRMGEDVGALECLGEVAEDVVNEEDALLGGGRAGLVCGWGLLVLEGMGGVAGSLHVFRPS